MKKGEKKMQLKRMNEKRWKNATKTNEWKK